jgi:hypothetical protein
MPPENWCGYLSMRRSRDRDADLIEQRDGAFPGFRLTRHVEVGRDGVDDLLAHGFAAG